MSDATTLPARNRTQRRLRAGAILVVTAALLAAGIAAWKRLLEPASVVAGAAAGLLTGAAVLALTRVRPSTAGGVPPEASAPAAAASPGAGSSSPPERPDSPGAAEAGRSRHELEASHRELEQRVAQRTAELQRAVQQLLGEIARRTTSETRLEEKTRAMELIATGAPLARTLEAIVAAVEREDPEAMACIHTFEVDRQQLVPSAALQLRAWADQAGSIQVGPDASPCGAAAGQRERLVIPDLAVETRWGTAREDALRHGLRACWATPIQDRKGRLLGVITVYYRHVRSPGGESLRMLDSAAHSAAVALEHDQLERARQQLERQLQQAHKLEAVGQLAGGVAHGLNNLLVPVLVYADLVRQEVSKDPALVEQLDQIIHASRRARGLIQELLAFSRQQAPHPTPLELEPIIREVLGLLRPTLPADVEAKSVPAPTDWPVHGDAAQIHHLVLNLCTNAIQAMAEAGGQLSVSRTLVERSRRPGLAAATAATDRFVCLEVTDTGPGMTPDVRTRLFEPFFTTRKTSTGLGLAVVHGIVLNHGGIIEVDTAPGQGTSFRVYLPAASEPAPAAEAAPAPPSAAPTPAPAGRLVLVDDEEYVARVSALLLERHGYAVKVFGHATEALEWLREDPQRCDLLVTDVTMPGMSGTELARAANGIRPALPILFVTGHGALDDIRSQHFNSPTEILPKPFDSGQLLSSVEKMVLKGFRDGPRETGGSPSS